MEVLRGIAVGTGVAIGEAVVLDAEDYRIPYRSIPEERIADELKEQDGEIVTNSIRFRWRDVREQLRKRIDRDAICAEWRAVER